MKKYFKYLILSFVFITLTSQLSFIYPINEWVDTNAFFTVGKSIFNKVVLYKDIYEQKGLILYIIYGVGYLISSKSFIGVYILEILSCSFLLFLVHKIILLYVDYDKSIYALVVFLLILTSTSFFSGGGSAEEFCLPCIVYCFYLLLIKEVSIKQLFISGIMMSIVLFIKFNLVVFWIIPVLIVLKDNPKKILYFILGVIIPISLCLLYFIITDSFIDFIKVYFIDNIFTYGVSSKPSLIDGFFRLFIDSILANYIFIIPLFYSLFYYLNRRYYSVLFVFFISFFVICCQGSFHVYYPLPFIVFVFPALRFVNIIKNKWYINILFSIIIVSLTIIICPNVKMIKYSKNDFASYNLCQIINRYEDKTILHYGMIDSGCYFFTDTIPNVRFFITQNMNYDLMNREQKRYIDEGIVNFIVMISSNKDNKFITFDKYDLIYSTHNSFSSNLNYFLYKRK